jgi:hypothetical protein
LGVLEKTPRAHPKFEKSVPENPLKKAVNFRKGEITFGCRGLMSQGVVQ